jgi:hypothetical protein
MRSARRTAIGTGVNLDQPSSTGSAAASNSQIINQTETIQKYFPPTLAGANFPPGQRRPKIAPLEPDLAVRSPVLQFFSTRGGKRMFNRSIAKKAMVVVTALSTLLGTTVMPAQAQSATPIKHVVVIFQENVSLLLCNLSQSSQPCE